MKILAIELSYAIIIQMRKKLHEMHVGEIFSIRWVWPFSNMPTDENQCFSVLIIFQLEMDGSKATYTFDLTLTFCCN